MLPLCDAFVTHGGMGSVMEALLHRVPLAVIPVFGDQIWNADRAGAARGAAVHVEVLPAHERKRWLAWPSPREWARAGASPLAHEHAPSVALPAWAAV